MHFNCPVSSPLLPKNFTFIVCRESKSEHLAISSLNLFAISAILAFIYIFSVLDFILKKVPTKNVRTKIFVVPPDFVESSTLF